MHSCSMCFAVEECPNSSPFVTLQFGRCRCNRRSNPRMRRACTPVRSAPLQLVRRSPRQSLPAARVLNRSFHASRFPRSETPPIPPPQVETDANKPAADAGAKPAAPSSKTILSHSISAYRFLNATVAGQLGIAWVVSPLILADEQFILNPIAPWLAFGLPVWATGQWMLWRWFARHWVLELRSLPGPKYEFVTMARSFGRLKTRSVLPADLFSRERVTGHTSIIRLKDKSYFLLSALCSATLN